MYISHIFGIFFILHKGTNRYISCQLLTLFKVVFFADLSPKISVPREALHLALHGKKYTFF